MGVRDLMKTLASMGRGREGVLLRNTASPLLLRVGSGYLLLHNKAPETVLTTTTVIHFAPESVGWLGSARPLSLGVLQSLGLGPGSPQSFLRSHVWHSGWEDSGSWGSLDISSSLCGLQGNYTFTRWLKAPRGSVPRGTSRGCMPFSANLALEVTQCHLHCTLLSQVATKAHPD